MAWCPHCNQDRPIQRQTYEGLCPHCGFGKRVQERVFPHDPACRGPVPGALDVCTHCNTPVFAKALDKQTYDRMVNVECHIRNRVKVKPASARKSVHQSILRLWAKGGGEGRTELLS